MPTTATATRTRFIVMYRPGHGRWKKIDVKDTHSEAVRRINCAGDWWIREVEVEEEQVGLFDAEDEP